MLAFVLMILVSLFFAGIINRTKAITSGRKGPAIFQKLKDVWRLLKKGSVFSTTTSYVFQIGPAIYFASVVVAMLVVPYDKYEGIFSFKGDFIFFAYILALGKFFLIISALDTGSPFQGMGANREALYSMLAEPAFFVLMGSFAMLTGHSSFYEIYNTMHYGTNVSYLLGILATYILVQIALIENSRLPVDDPNTHLELTMVHEVMILDHSGFDLGIIMYSTYLKFAIYGTLIANFFIGPKLPLAVTLVLFFTIQVLFAISVGILESFRARARLKRNPQMIFTLTAISILIFFGVLIIMNKFSI
jgi:formate hydrogenlyase subunit 4